LKIAIFASVRGVPVGLMPFRLVWKNENVWLPDGIPPDGEKNMKICLFLSTAYTNVTDGQTDST